MQLLPIGDIHGAGYNPRHTDPQRLELLKLSLRKLGFLMPLYVDASGEILSGHQRHLAATQLGAEQIPVEATATPLDLDKRKSLNLLFNRATNDMSETDNSTTATRALARTNLEELAAALPDLDPRSPAFFPCFSAIDEPSRPLIEANNSRWINYSKNVNASLARFGISLPIIVRPDGVVVNGIGRLQLAAERGAETVRVVRVSDQQAEFAAAMLNLLTMDFRVQDYMADEIRFHNFRRARQNPKTLGTGYRMATGVGDLANLKNRQRWIGEHGRSILDFGAGLLTEKDMLTPYGVEVDQFEPYVNNGHDDVDADKSRAVAREFLEVVATGRQWSSIFLNFVLNSVPFDSDRRAILTILASLRSRAYISSKSTKHDNYRHVSAGARESQRSSQYRTFLLGYEPGIVMSELSAKFRTQKFFEPAEFVELLREFWGRVHLTENGAEIRAVCFAPRDVPAEQLDAALAFEFDLPYPDGSRMGLADVAREAWRRRAALLA